MLKIDTGLEIILIFLTISPVSGYNCNEPTGSDCSWYKDCLENINTCGTQGYALNYALSYCNKYEKNFNKFSSEGQKWIAAVKKCLQLKLASLLKSKVNEKLSCAFIKQFAFDSHLPCYVDPTGSRTYSFCSLSIKDKYEVVNTIKGAFLSEFVATVKGGRDLMNKCWFNIKQI
ncbi:uncharacterized protein LOC100213149 [Hydra vulgaris]|uniref:uncharacterized protein LOC100213149 n=1 Tax=Hydra vulgaris TaxID=6087 RepID=UPI0032EA8988